MPNSPSLLDRPVVVLLVDDQPQSLGALVQALESEGATVLVADSGPAALLRLDLVTPDAILMDAKMPGMSGFEACKAIKAHPAWQHIPVIFMTGLSETEDIVAGFQAGGVDYVVKPVRAPELMVRLATHMRNARAARMARDAVDVGGHGVLVMDAHARVAWQSPQAQRWLHDAFPGESNSNRPGGLTGSGEPSIQRHPMSDGSVLVARKLGAIGMGEVMWLLSVERRDPASPSRLVSASLTPRETEVLSWVAKGKTNRDVGDILGLSPRTVNKHLEHIFEKLGVETRAAAAALASRELG